MSQGHDRNAAAHVGPHGASIVNDFPNSQVATLTTGLWQNILQTSVNSMECQSRSDTH